MTCENIFDKKDSDGEDLPDFLIEETDEENRNSKSEEEWAEMVEEWRMHDEAEAEEMWEWREANRKNIPEGMKIPFTGHPDIDFVGLTNEKDLVKICPDEFKQNNPWTKYASHFFKKDGRMIIATHWKYKSGTEEERRHKLFCFEALLASTYLSSTQKTSIAGWMLSEILEEVPEYKYRIDYY